MSALRFHNLTAAVTAVLSSCSLHTQARIVNPTFPRPGMCPEAITVFTAPSDVGKPYIDVAQLSVSYGLHPVPSIDDIRHAQRKKAAWLGANGIILGHIVGGHKVRYDAAVAIFIPDDSAKSAAVCTTRQSSLQLPPNKRLELAGAAK